MDARGHRMQLWIGMKPRLIPDNDMLGLRIARRQAF
jgi:hypothetical protein